MTVSASLSQSVALQSLDPRCSLADAVYHVLREAITDGALEPGTRLREAAVAGQLSVSATPVREALRRLEREGLVESAPHCGTTVAEISPTVMANLYDLHEMLEAHATRRAAERGPHDLASISAILDRIDASLNLTDQRAFNRLDLELHRAINTLSGNPEIVNLAEQTHRRIQAARVRFDIHLPRRPVTSQVMHRRIVAAIAHGDADAAETLARQHIGAVRGPVLDMLEGTPIANNTSSSV